MFLSKGIIEKSGRCKMNEPFNSPDIMINNLNDNSLQHIQATFMALVDAIIPRTPELAAEYGEVQYFGAFDLYIDDFVIWSLNHYDIPLTESTAEMLDLAAEQLVSEEGNQEALDYSMFPGGGPFAALAPSDRFRAITLLQQLKVNLETLPIPFYNNPGLVLSVTSALNRLTILGYYSEWSGYGSTRLVTPNQRILEYYPLSWQQVGYPGPSLGYGALRNG
jgi:hypothetical protein